MARACVAAELEDVHSPERTAGISGAEAKVLVISRPVLAIQVDMKELAVPERLRQPGAKFRLAISS